MNNIIKQKIVSFKFDNPSINSLQKELDLGWKVVNLEYIKKDNMFVARLELSPQLYLCQKIKNASLYN